ncbi:MAG TPA: HAD-IA family hydrolase [Egibacteraceae bacterium]|nr:HAD-IA family hydrolase [Egibacteraceae bacterium]
MPEARGVEPRRGLLVDYGGVLTSSVTRSFRAFCREQGLDGELAKETFLEAYTTADGEESAIHKVEKGLITAEEFAELLAGIFSRKAGRPVPAEGLIAGLFSRMELNEELFAAVAAARRAGVRTGLLSNSWGTHAQPVDPPGLVPVDALGGSDEQHRPQRLDGYPRHRFGETFDAVVISGEVGMRKPDEDIYRYAAELLGLEPAGCVFVDDLDRNVEVAERLGMAGIVHRDNDETLPRLAELLGLELSLLRGAA